MLISAEKQRDLAHQLHDQQKWEKAQKAYAKAITTYTKLATTPAGKDDLATILYDAGALFTDTGQFDHAGAVFAESASLFKELTRLDPDKHAANLATSLCNQGSVFNNTHQYEHAVPVLEQAAELQRVLNNGERRNIKAELSSTLRNLASALQGIHDLSRTKNVYLELFEIDRQLAADNPQAYTLPLSQSLCNYASFLCENGQLEEALTTTYEALSVHRSAEDISGPSHPIDKAMIYAIRGKTLKKQDCLDDALSAFVMAVSIVQMLVENQQLQFMHKLAVLLNESGEIQLLLGKLDPAILSFEQALDIFTRLANTNPAPYVADMVDLYQALAEIYREKHNNTQAKTYYKSALTLLEPYKSLDDPDNAISGLIKEIVNNANAVD